MADELGLSSKQENKALRDLYADPDYNTLFGVAELIREAQKNLLTEINHPGIRVHNKVKTYLESNPRSYAVTSTAIDANFVSITKVSWI